MTKTEILQCVANSHNCLADVMVSGDGAIMMGEALKTLRTLVRELQKDIAEEESKAGRE